MIGGESDAPTTPRCGTRDGRIDEAEIYKRKRDAFRLDNAIRSDDDFPREADSLFNELDIMHERVSLTGDASGFKARFDKTIDRIEELGGIPEDEDPYVGFSSNIPLFVEQAGPDGKPAMVTAKNKLPLFNFQRFVALHS